MSAPILGPGYNEKNYLVTELMATQNIRKWVVSRQSTYQTLTNISELVGGSIATPEQADNRNLRLPYLPSLIVGAQIKTGGRTSVSGTILQLQFVDPTYMGFMNDRIVNVID